MWNRLFYLKWLLFNLIGFISGSYLGATSTGLIPAWVPGISGIILGDLVFGSVIGLFQWLALRNNRRFPISAWWIALLSLGFTFGARAGSQLTYRIANDWLMPSVVFGVFMGGSTGLAVVPLFWKNVPNNRLPVWVAVSVFAWVAGEQISFSTDFVQAAVPWVALTTGSIKGLGILWLQYSTNIPDG